MLVTRTSQSTGVTRSRDLPVTPEQLAAYESGKDLVQNIFPHLSDSDREFLISGMTDEEYDELFAEYSSYHYERNA